MKIKHNSIFFRLIWLGFSGTLLSVLTLGAYIAYQQGNQVIQSAQMEADLINNGLSTALAADLIVRNYAGIEQTVIESTNHPYLNNLKVVNNHGVIIITAWRDSTSGNWQFSHGGSIEPPSKAITQSDLTDQKIIIWSPVMAGNLVGWVRSEMSLTHVAELQRRIIADSLFVALVSAGLSIVILVMVVRKPINEIKQATHFAAKLPDHFGQKLPVKSRLTEIQHLIAALNNTSEKLQNQDQNLKLLETLIEYSEDSFYILDKDDNFRMIFANNAACRHFGLPKEKLLSLRMPDWDLDIDLSKLSALWIQLQTVKHLTFTSRHKLVSGEIIPVEITANYIRFNQHDLVAGYFREIRQRVEAEMELKKSRDLAEQVAKSKSEFLANMSHEIRTPMNAIIGLSQLALDRPMDDDLRKYVETIGDCSKSLLNILNNILEFSRLEAIGVKIEPAPFDLRQLIQQLSNLFQEAAHTKGLDFIVRIDPNIPEQLNGDAIRIQQILSNLLGNSIKFTQNGFVSLSVGLINLATPKISLNFVVSDSGIGISNENLAKLFKPFSQIDGSISRKFGGTGLGLAISRNLLQRMGGDFIINSTPNLGTCISFNLELTIHATENQELPKDPLPSKAGELAKYMQENGATLSGILVLVAEDNRINQQVICEYLKLAGVSTLIANNGQEVLDLLEHHPVKAILMDIQMPIMDGKQATRNIRNQAAYHHLPIIALTAGVTEEDKLSCLEAGIDDMIGKPIDPKKLIEVLKKCIFN